jgi:hypothetical protein
MPLDSNCWDRFAPARKLAEIICREYSGDSSVSPSVTKPGNQGGKALPRCDNFVPFSSTVGCFAVDRNISSTLQQTTHG